jgi:hypothetical protein
MHCTRPDNVAGEEQVFLGLLLQVRMIRARCKYTLLMCLRAKAHSVKDPELWGGSHVFLKSNPRAPSGMLKVSRMLEYEVDRLPCSS